MVKEYIASNEPEAASRFLEEIFLERRKRTTISPLFQSFSSDEVATLDVGLQGDRVGTETLAS